jgi:hypothetical protein
MAKTIGTRIRQLITRGAALNDSRQRVNRSTRDLGGFNIQRTDISFTGTNTIACAGNAFPNWAVGTNIQITGSALNNREFQILTRAAGSITVEPALVTTESAGALIDVRPV